MEMETAEARWRSRGRRVPERREMMAAAEARPRTLLPAKSFETRGLGPPAWEEGDGTAGEGPGESGGSDADAAPTGEAPDWWAEFRGSPCRAEDACRGLVLEDAAACGAVDSPRALTPELRKSVRAEVAWNEDPARRRDVARGACEMCEGGLQLKTARKDEKKRGRDARAPQKRGPTNCRWTKAGHLRPHAPLRVSAEAEDLDRILHGERGAFSRSETGACR